MSGQGQLAWNCRRGMKELDLLLRRYLDHRWPQASAGERAAFEAFLELPDPVIAGYLLGTCGAPPMPRFKDSSAALRGPPRGLLADLRPAPDIRIRVGEGLSIPLAVLPVARRCAGVAAAPYWALRAATGHPGADPAGTVLPCRAGYRRLGATPGSPAARAGRTGPAGADL